jgi:hypothetical protein
MPETGTFELLKKYGVAYTNVDEPLLPPEVHLTADFTRFTLKKVGIGELLRDSSRALVVLLSQETLTNSHSILVKNS